MKNSWRLVIAFAVLGCFTWCAQSVRSMETQETRVMREFRGVRLGLKPEEVRAALGNPASKADNREEFSFDGDNQITIHYDNGQVKAIQIYFADATKAPSWAEVTGDAEIEEMANGAKSARKVVSEENFWVTMYRSKDGTIARITISRQ